jgi:hypothetical protein
MKTIAIIVCVIHVSLGLSHLLFGSSQKRAAPKAVSKDSHQGLRNSAPKALARNLVFLLLKRNPKLFSHDSCISIELHPALGLIGSSRLAGPNPYSAFTSFCVRQVPPNQQLRADRRWWIGITGLSAEIGRLIWVRPGLGRLVCSAI